MQHRAGRYEEALTAHQGALSRCTERSCQRLLPTYSTAVAEDLLELGQAKQALPDLENALRLQPEPRIDRAAKARTEFALAQALTRGAETKRPLPKGPVKAPARAPARAIELAQSALARYREVGRSALPEQEAVQTWLQKNAPPPGAP
jgi:tetratricopeptide (TPR) repeat protein